MKIALLAVLLMMAAPGCKAEPKPKYAVGEFVRLRISGHVGQVIWAPSSTRRQYEVRLSASAIRTNTHLLGRDGPVEHLPVSKAWLYEFELEPCPPSDE